jgi:MFS family permease
VAAVAVLATAGTIVVAYSVHGWLMWVAATGGAVAGAATTPAFTVYGAELFGTGRRGAANGVLTAAGRIGAVAGLLIVGRLVEGHGNFGLPFALLATGPILLAILVLTTFPETAGRTLEELNPEDAVPPSPDHVAPADGP